MRFHESAMSTSPAVFHPMSAAAGKGRRTATAAYATRPAASETLTRKRARPGFIRDRWDTRASYAVAAGGARPAPRAERSGERREPEEGRRASAGGEVYDVG